MARLKLNQHKLSQTDPTVTYMGPEEGPFLCAHCEYFKGPNGCKKVAGHIDPNGCCNLYESVEEDEESGEEEATET